MLGSLSENPQEYSMCPILISGTCKKETGPEHEKLIQMALTAAENTKNEQSFTTYQTVSIALDGKSKHSDALVILTMKKILSSQSPLYPQLHKLELMNHLVGEDDITADKDFKHIFKWQQNLMMRNKGFEIQEFCITPAILCAQLQSNGVPTFQLKALLNPDDK